MRSGSWPSQRGSGRGHRDGGRFGVDDNLLDYFLLVDQAPREAGDDHVASG